MTMEWRRNDVLELSDAGGRFPNLTMEDAVEEVHSHNTRSVFRASFQNMASLGGGGACTTDEGVAPVIAADAPGAPSSAVRRTRCILWMKVNDTPVRSLAVE